MEHSIESAARYGHSLSQRVDRIMFAANFKSPTIALVLRLFSICRPSTISRAIRSVRIDAIDRQSFRARPHIRVEVFKTVKPAIADSDSSAAVMLKVGIARTEATAAQAAPNAVLWCIRHSVRSALVGAQLRLHATATARAFQISKAGEPGRSAVAAVFNQAFTTSDFICQPDQNHSPESLANGLVSGTWSRSARASMRAEAFALRPGVFTDERVAAFSASSGNLSDSHAVPPFRGREWSGAPRVFQHFGAPSILPHGRAYAAKVLAKITP